MREFPRYRRIPLEVAAVQWLGENAAELEGFLGAHFDRDPESGDAAVLTTRHSVWEPLILGDWVLIAPGARIEVLRSDEFAEMFEAVDPDA